MVDAIKLAIETIWLVFYKFWLDPECPVELRAILWMPIIGTVAGGILRAIRGNRSY